MQRYHKFLIFFAAIIGIALAAHAGNLLSSGGCDSGDCEIGHAGVSTFTITTDGTGDGEVVLPASSIGGSEIATGAISSSKLDTNSVTVTTFATMTDKIIICGQDANDGTIYLGPAVAEYLGNGTEFAIGGTACNAYDDATEGTADAPISADFPTFKVTGMFCRTSSDATNNQVLTLRSAEADLTPTVTCTIAGAGSGTSCSTITTTTTNIVAGATIAVKSVNTEDLSTQDVWCEVYFAIRAS